MGIPMLKIRRSRDRLVFNMRIPILAKRHLYIETYPRDVKKVSVSWRRIETSYDIKHVNISIAQDCLLWYLAGFITSFYSNHLKCRMDINIGSTSEINTHGNWTESLYRRNTWCKAACMFPLFQHHLNKPCVNIPWRRLPAITPLV